MFHAKLKSSYLRAGRDELSSFGSRSACIVEAFEALGGFTSAPAGMDGRTYILSMWLVVESHANLHASSKTINVMSCLFLAQRHNVVAFKGWTNSTCKHSYLHCGL